MNLSEPPPSLVGAARVPLDRVDWALHRLWEQDEQAGGTGAHASLCTIVALASLPSLVGRANEVLAQVVRVHPARTITASWTADGPPEIVAEVALHRDPDRGGEACGDAVALLATGGARVWLPENVDRLLLSGVPAYIWWVGDLPDYDDLFDRLVRCADVAVVNSAEMDLRDLEKLSRIADESRGAYAVADLTWVRLRGMMDLVARFFDAPESRPWLDRLARVTMGFSPRDGETDVVSTRVGLLVGWLGNALGFRPETARWTRDAGGGSLAIERRGGPGVLLRFDRDPRAGADPGSITRIELVCGTAGEARFSVARQEDPRTLSWSCVAPGLALPEHTLRFGSHEEPKLLARFLDRPARDPLYEAALRMGSRIVRPVAPRFSEAPPR